VSPEPRPKPVFFATQAELRRWLRKNHKALDEAWIGFYKKSTGRPTITWQQLVDELLCFGWIDGVRKGLDSQSFVNRVTPRRKGSVWSPTNTKRATELIEQGKMTRAGLAAFEARDLAKTNRLSSEREAPELDEAYLAELRAKPEAWKFFQAQPPYYRKLAALFVMSARREETRRRRLGKLIQECASGRRLEPMGKASPARDS
jgi:uncharacterized protein YdeI (YjbR/CyaY-like superfamily)